MNTSENFLFSVLKSSEWEQVRTDYEDEDYVVFRQVGKKENSCLWLHVQSTYAALFITERIFLRNVNSLRHIEKIEKHMFGNR